MSQRIHTLNAYVTDAENQPISKSKYESKYAASALNTTKPRNVKKRFCAILSRRGFCISFTTQRVTKAHAAAMKIRPSLSSVLIESESNAIANRLAGDCDCYRRTTIAPHFFHASSSSVDAK